MGILEVMLILLMLMWKDTGRGGLDQLTSPKALTERKTSKKLSLLKKELGIESEEDKIIGKNTFLCVCRASRAEWRISVSCILPYNWIKYFESFLQFNSMFPLCASISVHTEFWHIFISRDSLFQRKQMKTSTSNIWVQRPRGQRAWRGTRSLKNVIHSKFYEMCIIFKNIYFKI